MQELGFNYGIILNSLGFIIEIVIIVLCLISALKLRGSNMFWVALIFIVAASFMAIHSIIELQELGETYYALTALFVSLLLATTMYIVNNTLKKLGMVG
jgi:hypothetical protein